MAKQIICALILSGLSDAVINVSDSIFHLANSLVGRFWIVDNLIALPVDNEFIKAALLGCCFLAVWFGQQTEEETRRVRKILLATLIACVFVIATTKTLSKTVFLPRPFIQSKLVYHLQDEQLVENHRLSYRVPLDKSSQDSYRDLLNGEIARNDLGSFPSDHAGFFVTVAAGIWLASRGVGLIALAWTFFVILFGRVMTGMHSPLDIIAGAAIGITILAFVQFVLRKWFGGWLERVVSWSLQHSAMTSALLFALLFEVSNTLVHLPPLAKFGIATVKHLLGKGN